MGIKAIAGGTEGTETEEGERHKEKVFSQESSVQSPHYSETHYGLGSFITSKANRNIFYKNTCV